MQKQMKQDLLKQGDLEGANAINIEEELEDDVSVHGEVYSIQHYVIKFVSDL
jgi:hypothetical protein